MNLTREHIAWYTEVGRRENNEDCCAFQIAPDGSAALLIVADGMGGHASGEDASRKAVDVLLKDFEENGFANAGVLLQNALFQAHEEIQLAARDDVSKRGMGTTVVAAVLREGQVMVGHAGDSRALQFRGDTVRRLTQDHLFAIDALGVEENKAKQHPHGNVLSQALGSEGAIQPAFNTFDLAPGDSIVLCSDGVSEHVSEPMIRRVLLLHSLPEAAAEIVHLALRKGSRDNCTVAIATIPAVSA